MTNTKQIILGFDPGLADTGYGVISKEDNKLEYIVAGSIQTPKNTDFGDRLEEIYNQANKIIKKYNPDLIAVEKLFFARNVTTALNVGQCRGVVLLAIQQNKKDLLEFTPLQIKQAVAATGSAGKLQVGRMVKAILNLKSIPQPDDAADDLAIAICASFYNKKLV